MAADINFHTPLLKLPKNNQSLQHVAICRVSQIVLQSVYSLFITTHLSLIKKGNAAEYVAQFLSWQEGTEQTLLIEKAEVLCAAGCC